MNALVAIVGLLIAGLVAIPLRAARKREQAAAGGWGIASVVAGGALAIGAAGLMLTSLGGIFAGAELRGWVLLAHVSVSPLFLAGLVLFARFSPRSGAAAVAARTVILTGIVTAAAMVASMLPLFGYDQLLELRDLHRYGGLLFLMSCVTYIAGVMTPVRS